MKHVLDPPNRRIGPPFRAWGQFGGLLATKAFGTLPGKFLTANTGIQTFGASGDFTGAGLTFSVNSVAGAAINSSTGVVSFDTDVIAPQASMLIVVTVTNAVGSDTSGFNLDIIVVPETAPDQMGAPSLAVDGPTQITATPAAAPPDGGSSITEYDLRYRTTPADAGTTQQNVTSLVAITLLTASTEYEVQTRAQNAVGNGAWSVGATETTAVVAPTVSVMRSSDTVPYSTVAGSTLATIGGIKGGTLTLEDPDAADFQIDGIGLENVAQLNFDGTRAVTVRRTKATDSATARFDLTVEATLPTLIISLSALVDGETFGQLVPGADVEATVGGVAPTARSSPLPASCAQAARPAKTSPLD